jgi:dihydroxyacid dehydratase/phosphogluconate dehydratase
MHCHRNSELAARRSAWRAPTPKYERGYGLLYLKHVSQADTGCDFDFLEMPAGRAGTPEPEIH